MNHEVSGTSPGSIIKINVLSWAFEMQLFPFSGIGAGFRYQIYVWNFFYKKQG
jgi:hypothetical protein